MESVSPAFEALAITPQFDDFLMYLLNYFHWFFEKRAQDTKPNPMNIEPSRAEIQLHQELCDKLENARKQLGRAYCVLILGIGLGDHHHMSCGRSRVSSTYKDRQMYETMYSFLTFLVWICFKRKEFEVVKKEIGRILRSDTFNPALRVKMAPAETHEEGEAEKKLTPAEYRRLHGKRPPIKSIINQRSLVLVSIMPDPREEADWLFNRSGALSPTTLNNMAKEELDEIGPSVGYQDINLSKLKVGIIGEPCSQFNPITLTPLGLDTEEEEDSERAEREANEAKAKAAVPHRDSTVKQLSRQATAISTVTTDAHLSDED
jgi:protein phosphatase 1 regulatory subunit 36